jgi:hypothetical protein
MAKAADLAQFQVNVEKPPLAEDATPRKASSETRGGAAI